MGIRRIVCLLAVAAGLGAASLGCAEDDCTEADLPRFEVNPVYVPIDIMEEKVVDLEGRLRSDSSCTMLSLGRDPAPFVIEPYLDGEGLKLRIVAPDRLVFEGNSFGLVAENPCGRASAGLTIAMNYGCTEMANPFVGHGGIYLGRVLSTIYLQATGIRVSPGSTVRIRAEGNACWRSHDVCAGPDQTPSTWGIWARIGESYFPVGSYAELAYDGSEEAELKFIFPDSDRPAGTIGPGDEEFCVRRDYKDNSGAFDVAVEVVESGS
ncbi:MAG: hypothetical protein KKD17_03575 [Nanoarchaeota archaeon]|nr:hypothetical protein [Nanoarchaeota archaeon]